MWITVQSFIKNDSHQLCIARGTRACFDCTLFSIGGQDEQKTKSNSLQSTLTKLVVFERG